ncbi:hypothetical protein CH063_14297 [Colletotrichum higginsianum]|uniref:Uncharacterized protein n=1 Tax=Colletotrichum higginsianum (strain IMI 349063) TaxID=759273 RepID=H1VY01_COLHI|nr:hypothetical protein CH063_14297 [Colletotrichum higginsianum]
MGACCPGHHIATLCVVSIHQVDSFSRPRSLCGLPHIYVTSDSPAAFGSAPPFAIRLHLADKAALGRPLARNTRIRRLNTFLTNKALHFGEPLPLTIVCCCSRALISPRSYPVLSSVM